jgi:hypothetical protein
MIPRLKAFRCADVRLTESRCMSILGQYGAPSRYAYGENFVVRPMGTARSRPNLWWRGEVKPQTAKSDQADLVNCIVTRGGR